MTASRNLLLGLLFGLIAGAFWGGVFLAPRLLAEFTPLQMTAGRYIAYGLASAVLLAPSRKAVMGRMTGEDCAWLGDVAGIRTIMDLRHPDEFRPAAAHALQERVYSLSLFPAARPLDEFIAELNGLHGPGPTGARYLTYLEHAGEGIAQAFTVFADETRYPILVHCTAGKDRTGVLLGLLMDVLGADHEDIASEYGLSDASIPRLIAFLRASGRTLEGSEDEITARLSTPPDRMAAFLDGLTATYGGAAAYLGRCGVTDATLDAVRRLLVVPAE